MFITFEGGDGSGKTTQLNLFREYLEAQGKEVVITREPGGSELGLEIRQILLHSTGPVWPRAEALLYAADRSHHIATVVRPALEAGKFVLQDRYIDSSVAYQGAGRQIDAEQIEQLSIWATEGLWPELTFLIDVDPAIAKSRIPEDAPFDRLEAEKQDFHVRVREHYLTLAARHPERIKIVDGSKTPAEVFEEVISIYSAKIAN